MGKHAYLIMAHNQENLLKILIQCLDYEENDIFIHLDKKWKDVNEKEICAVAKKSKIEILERRIDVKWGTYSQIECEMLLLEKAISGHYQYYHLMSGMDLPLKKQKEIHDFFDAQNGTEFIHFEAPEIDLEAYHRVSKYNLFVFKSRNLWKKILTRISMVVQIKVDRVKKYNLVFQKGANWFSITDGLAQYVVCNKDIIEKIFKYARCGDEMFLQTLVINSKYKNNIVSGNFCDNYETIQYCIDWDRGSPYVFRIEDYDSLIHSNMCFARKFDSNIDAKIIKKIQESVIE